MVWMPWPCACTRRGFRKWQSACELWWRLSQMRSFEQSERSDCGSAISSLSQTSCSKPRTSWNLKSLVQEYAQTRFPERLPSARPPSSCRRVVSLEDLRELLLARKTLGNHRRIWRSGGRRLSRASWWSLRWRRGEPGARVLLGLCGSLGRNMSTLAGKYFLRGM